MTESSRSAEKEICLWQRGATDGVYKSTCSLVPFLSDVEPADGTACEFCGDTVRVVDSDRRLMAKRETK